MLTDAHCHIYDLAQVFPVGSFIEEIEQTGCLLQCAASAWNREEFEFHERFAHTILKNIGGVSIIQCFAVHPQLPAVKPDAVKPSLETLYAMAAENRVDAIGETGFDLFNPSGRSADRIDYRMTEKVQDELFAEHLDLAITKGLPLVLHIRKAMHKVFAYSNQLKRVSAVIFHSYSGTCEDGQNLLRRGVNAYFSFGTPLLLNHKTAQSACARLPLDRLLSETDAPYQPLRGESFSHWGNVPAIQEKMAELRKESMKREAIATVIEENFRIAYG